MAQAAKRAGRATTEGLVGYRIDGDARHDGRGRLRDRARLEERRVPGVREEGARGRRTRTARRRSSRSRTSASSCRAKLGENIVVAGAERYEAGDGEVVGAYAHPPANKIGVLVKLDGGDAELARQLAMHISFAAPEWTTREDVPAEVVEAERQVYLNSDELEGKPEQAQEKIVEGMLAKRFFAAQPGGVLDRAAVDPRLGEDGRPGARRGRRACRRVQAPLCRRIGA